MYMPYAVGKLGSDQTCSQPRGTRVIKIGPCKGSHKTLKLANLRAPLKP